MQLPRKSAAYPRRIAYSAYTERRLRRATHSSLADELTASRKCLLGLGRTWEDLAIPVQEALAERDAIDDSLDRLTQNIRLRLSSRSMDAIRQAPYINVFPESIRYYTEAPLNEQVARYSELKTRMTTALPPDDPELESLVELDKLLTTWSEMTLAIEDARLQETLAREQLESQTVAWEALIEKVYGQLVSLEGKKKADRYFSRVE